MDTELKSLFNQSRSIEIWRICSCADNNTGCYRETPRDPNATAFCGQTVQTSCTDGYPLKGEHDWTKDRSMTLTVLHEIFSEYFQFWSERRSTGCLVHTYWHLWLQLFLCVVLDTYSAITSETIWIQDPCGGCADIESLHAPKDWLCEISDASRGCRAQFVHALMQPRFSVFLKYQRETPSLQMPQMIWHWQTLKLYWVNGCKLQKIRFTDQ